MVLPPVQTANSIFPLFLKQAAPRMARRLLAVRVGQVFARKLAGKNAREGIFHPLSRVPLSLQPPHFVAVAGCAALPIGARLSCAKESKDKNLIV